MKNNTQKSKSYLIEAIRNMPNDNVLADAKRYLHAALRQMEDVEKKRGRRTENLTPHQSWQENLNKGVANPFSAQQTMENLDKMIAEEKAKLDSMKQQRMEKEQSGGQFLTD